MRFDDDTVARARAQLLGPRSDALIGYMQTLSLSRDTGGVDPEVVQVARDLGWIAGPADQRTELGFCAADSCREYRFWVERDRQLPFAGAAPHLEPERFRDRQVLEIGSGMGCNLMSLAAVGAKTRGLEPVEAYTQLGAIFCEREGLPVPEVRQGSAEDLPFGDGEIDLILCVSAHQYFDIHSALAEMARVLRPGGEVIIIGGTLGSFASGFLREIAERPAAAKAYVITIANTLSYTALGQRIIPGRGKLTTTRPIYPAPRAMRRMLRRAGLREKTRTVKVGQESCFHTERSP